MRCREGLLERSTCVCLFRRFEGFDDLAWLCCASCTPPLMTMIDTLTVVIWGGNLNVQTGFKLRRNLSMGG